MGIDLETIKIQNLFAKDLTQELISDGTVIVFPEVLEKELFWRVAIRMASEKHQFLIITTTRNDYRKFRSLDAIHLFFSKYAPELEAWTVCSEPPKELREE